MSESAELKAIREITRNDPPKPVPDSQPICPACGQEMEVDMRCLNKECEMYSA